MIIAENVFFLAERIFSLFFSFFHKLAENAKMIIVDSTTTN